VPARAAQSRTAAAPAGLCLYLLAVIAQSWHGRPQLTEDAAKLRISMDTFLNSCSRQSSWRPTVGLCTQTLAARQGRIARHTQGAPPRKQTSTRTSPRTSARSAARALVGGRACSAAAAAAASAGAAAATGGAAAAAASAAAAAAGAAGWTMGRRTPWWRRACLSTRARARPCASSPSRRLAERWPVGARSPVLAAAPRSRLGVRARAGERGVRRGAQRVVLSCFACAGSRTPQPTRRAGRNRDRESLTRSTGAHCPELLRRLRRRCPTSTRPSSCRTRRRWARSRRSSAASPRRCAARRPPARPRRGSAPTAAGPLRTPHRPDAAASLRGGLKYSARPARSTSR